MQRESGKPIGDEMTHLAEKLRLTDTEFLRTGLCGLPVLHLGPGTALSSLRTGIGGLRLRAPRSALSHVYTARACQEQRPDCQEKRQDAKGNGDF
ncbi:hypothetical protein GCM10009647_089430 [Streptomyces sanglieri]